MGGCIGHPKMVTPVQDFELNRYLGKWYEIARLDHSFERGLERVTAEYSLREGGGILVKNRGYSTAKALGKKLRAKPFRARPDPRLSEGLLLWSFLRLIHCFRVGQSELPVCFRFRTERIVSLVLVANAYCERRASCPVCGKSPGIGLQDGRFDLREPKIAAMYQAKQLLRIIERYNHLLE